MNRSNKCRCTKDNVCLSQNFLLTLSQNNGFNSTTKALKNTQKLDAKSKLRSLNPIVDQNGLLRSSGRLLFAPTELEIDKCPIILEAKEKIARLFLEHARRICAHQATELAKSIRLTTLLRHRTGKNTPIKKYRCFLCHHFDTQNTQSIMAPLPAFHFPTEKTKFPFTNTGLDFFGRFILKTNKAKSKRKTLWTYFYTPRYASSSFGNKSRFKYRHFPQCILTVHLSKMTTYFIVQR